MSDWVELRSTLLKKMPTVFVEGRRERVLMRLAIVILLLIALFVVGQRLLPQNAVTQWLYALHDNFYLPIKGNTFTRYYPNSWIWWIVIFTLLVLTIGAWIVSRAWTRMGQTWLTERLINRPRTHRVLVWAAQMFNRIGVRPQHLFTTIDHAREQLMIRLEAGETLRRGTVKRLVFLHQLWLQIAALWPELGGDQAGILAAWHRLYLALHMHPEPVAERTMLRFLDSIDFIERDADPDERDGVFSAAQLWQDTDQLIVLGRQKWGTAHNQLTGAPQRALVSTAEQRQRLLFRVAGQIEREEMMAVSRWGGRGEALQALAMDSDHLPAIGQTAWLIAGQTALFTQSAALLVGTLEGIDMVKLMTGWTEVADVASWQALVVERPFSSLYRLSAALQKNVLTAQKEDWETLLEQENAPVVDADFDNVQMQIDALDRVALDEV